MTTPHPTLLDHLRWRRDALADMLALIDTTATPRPSHVDEGELAGVVWEPAHGWAVKCLDRDEVPYCIYVTPPPGLPGDMVALTPAQARDLAAALHAAADWADRRNTAPS